MSAVVAYIDGVVFLAARRLGSINVPTFWIGLSPSGRPEMFGPRRWDREMMPAYERQYGSSGHQ